MIYQLRLAHLRPNDPDPEPDPEFGDPADNEPELGRGSGQDARRSARPSASPRPAAGTATAHDEARQIALAAASTRGLGLTGPGAADALRALLLTLLAAHVTAGRQT